MTRAAVTLSLPTGQAGLPKGELVAKQFLLNYHR